MMVSRYDTSSADANAVSSDDHRRARWGVVADARCEDALLMNQVGDSAVALVGTNDWFRCGTPFASPSAVGRAFMWSVLTRKCGRCECRLSR